MRAWTRHVTVAAAVGAGGGALLGLREGSLVFWNQALYLASVSDAFGFVVSSLMVHVLLGVALLTPAGVLGGLVLARRWPEATPGHLLALYSGFFAALFSLALLGWARVEWISAHLISDRIAEVLVVVLAVGIGLATAGLIRLPLGRQDAATTRSFAWRAAGVLTLMLVVASVPLARLQALTISRSTTTESVATAPAGSPNVLWITLCTVRADHLSAYGYHRDTSPTLARMAADGVLYEHAVAPSCWTRPTHASLFTGSFLSKHGVDNERHRIPGAAVTFSEVARQAGYQTVGISNNYNAGSHLGLDRGFDLFVEVWGPLDHKTLLSHWTHQLRQTLWNERVNMCSARETNRIFSTWFDRHHDSERPFFAFINFAEGHDPYLPPDEIARSYLPADISLAEAKAYCRAAFIRHGKEISSDVPITERGLTIMQAMYDAELRYQDDRLGELLADLEQRQLLDQTLVVVVGDHGEHFGEHGLIGHENSLYEPLLHVPMLMRYPPAIAAGDRVQRLVQTTDIMPTTMGLMGLSVAVLGEQIQGNDLFAGNDNTPNRAIAEFDLTTEDGQRMLREGDWKLISMSAGDDELYDLAADPGEADNRLAAEIELGTRLARSLNGWSATSMALAAADDQIELEEKALRMLRSLGYVGGD